MNTEKLTLEMLSPYLPYGLKILAKSERIKTLVTSNPNSDLDKISVNALLDSIYGSKPILRPMNDFNHSDADKEICKIFGGYTSVLLNEIQDLQYSQVRILLKYHFDVFGLIEKGLAIDINTLEKISPAI